MSSSEEWGHRKGCSCNRNNSWAKLLGGETVRVTLTFIAFSWNLSAFILFGVYLWLHILVPWERLSYSLFCVFECTWTTWLERVMQWNNWLVHLHHDSWANPISIQFKAWSIQPLS